MSVDPRDLPFAAEGGTYCVVNGELRREADIEAATADSAPESTDVLSADKPVARQTGGRAGRTKE